jgi:glycosyltransferase involved in cell wall biosynthesis
VKVAIVHYWLINCRGGEKVLEAICELYPDADIYTHYYDASAFASSNISTHKVSQTFISKLPFARRFYQSYLPLMPLALEEIDLSGYDLVISSESGPAKGIVPPPGVPHICYCHSPMRYAWDMYHDYKSRAGLLKRLLIPFLMHYLRRWDQLSAGQVSHFVANSQFVSKRIKSYYRRDSEVIYPPVSFDEVDIADKVGDFYLLLGQLVAYKKADLAVEAFTISGRKLVVVGEGEQFDELRAIAGPNVDIRGRLPFPEIVNLLGTCRGLIFPGVEDFGIVPLEAMASGRPVIAYKKGGALETVISGKTGVFFEHQTVESLNASVELLEIKMDTFDPHVMRAHAKLFSKERFKAEFKFFADKALEEFL